MTTVVFAIPGDINLPTGGYTYDRRVLALLPQFGMDAQHLWLPDGYPAPSQGDLEWTANAFAKLPRKAVLMVDGLAYGAMPPDVIERAPCPIVALVHHPLCLETGLSDARAAELRASEVLALSLARSVVVTSAATARTLIDEFGVPGERITVAVPGTDRPPGTVRILPSLATAPRSRKTTASQPKATNIAPAPAPVQMLSVGSIVPRKGYDVLMRALGKLRHVPEWRLTIAGATDRSPETAEALRLQVMFLGLKNSVRLVGPLSESALADLYASADVFVMSSLYEGYGMVLAEAMTRGLPIVCTTGGAAADTVPDGAGIKVPPGDEAALTQAIDRVLRDAALRQRLADGSWAAGQALPRWEDTTAAIAAVIKELAP
jgi:glycosyltransferase involved in cell wall biosynthesis